jgi:hypothetical protein
MAWMAVEVHIGNTTTNSLPQRHILDPGMAGGF